MKRKLLYPILSGAGLAALLSGEANASLDSINVQPINDTLPYFTQVTDRLPEEIVDVVLRKDFPTMTFNYVSGDTTDVRLITPRNPGSKPKRQAGYVHGAFGYETLQNLFRPTPLDSIDISEEEIYKRAVADHLRDNTHRNVSPSDLEFVTDESGNVQGFNSSVKLQHPFADNGDGYLRAMWVDVYNSTSLRLPSSVIEDYVLTQLRGEHANKLYPEAVELASRLQNDNASLRILLGNQKTDTVTVFSDPVRLPSWEVYAGGSTGKYASIGGTLWLEKLGIRNLGLSGNLGFQFDGVTSTYTEDVLETANTYARNKLEQTIRDGKELLLGIEVRNDNGFLVGLHAGLSETTRDVRGELVEDLTLNGVTKTKITRLPDNYMNGMHPAVQRQPIVRANAGYSNLAVFGKYIGADAYLQRDLTDKSFKAGARVRVWK